MLHWEVSDYRHYQEITVKKMSVLDYGIPTYDQNIPDYGLDDLFDEDGIQPEINKQLVPNPPTYDVW